jgi:hypothetical protein
MKKSNQLNQKGKRAFYFFKDFFIVVEKLLKLNLLLI